MARSDSAGRRSRARELTLQALYQSQITGHDPHELLRQFHDRPDYEKVDQAYFDALLPAICAELATLKTELAGFADRPVEQLDPVELAALAIGYFELKARHEVPYRAVINEAVKLARRFGAQDGHKYVNAVLDRAARELRAAEVRRANG